MDKLQIAAYKLGRLRAAMARLKLDAVIITLQRNIGWLTGGRSHIAWINEAACCKLVVTAKAVFMLASRIEADRLMEEEFGPSGFAPLVDEVRIWPWQEPEMQHRLASELLDGYAVTGTDAELEREFASLRMTAHPGELEEWQSLGRHAGLALEEAAYAAQRGESEFELTARVARQCMERELEPVVLLAAVDERMAERRHPLPTGRRLEHSAMLVLCARRRGKIVSATRAVYFGRPPAERLRLHRAVAEIDARLHAATRPGKTLGGLYDDLRQWYTDAGYPGEEQRHHQGGLTGYLTREQLALPGSLSTVQAHQLYAWNPTLPGVKSEDTIWVGEEANLSVTYAQECSRSFPGIAIDIDGHVIHRPDILIRAHRS